MTRPACILSVQDKAMDAEFALSALPEVRLGATVHVVSSGEAAGATLRPESAPGRGTRVIIEVARGPA